MLNRITTSPSGPQSGSLADLENYNRLWTAPRFIEMATVEARITDKETARAYLQEQYADFDIRTIEHFLDGSVISEESPITLQKLPAGSVLKRWQDKNDLHTGDFFTLPQITNPSTVGISDQSTFTNRHGIEVSRESEYYMAAENMVAICSKSKAIEDSWSSQFFTQKTIGSAPQCLILKNKENLLRLNRGGLFSCIQENLTKSYQFDLDTIYRMSIKMLFLNHTNQNFASWILQERFDNEFMQIINRAPYKFQALTYAEAISMVNAIADIETFNFINNTIIDLKSDVAIDSIFNLLNNTLTEQLPNLVDLIGIEKNNSLVKKVVDSFKKLFFEEHKRRASLQSSVYLVSILDLLFLSTTKTKSSIEADPSLDNSEKTSSLALTQKIGELLAATIVEYFKTNHRLTYAGPAGFTSHDLSLVKEKLKDITFEYAQSHCDENHNANAWLIAPQCKEAAEKVVSTLLTDSRAEWQPCSLGSLVFDSFTNLVAAGHFLAQLHKLKEDCCREQDENELNESRNRVGRP